MSPLLPKPCPGRVEPKRSIDMEQIQEWQDCKFCWGGKKVGPTMRQKEAKQGSGPKRVCRMCPTRYQLLSFWAVVGSHPTQDHVRGCGGGPTLQSFSDNMWDPLHPLLHNQIRVPSRCKLGQWPRRLFLVLIYDYRL